MAILFKSPWDFKAFIIYVTASCDDITSHNPSQARSINWSVGCIPTTLISGSDEIVVPSLVGGGSCFNWISPNALATAKVPWTLPLATNPPHATILAISCGKLGYIYIYIYITAINTYYYHKNIYDSILP